MEHASNNSPAKPKGERMPKEKLTWTPEDERFARMILAEEKNIDRTKYSSPVLRYIMAAGKVRQNFKYRPEDVEFKRVLACIGHIGANVKKAKMEEREKVGDPRVAEFMEYAAKNPTMLHPEDEAELINILNQNRT